MVVMDYIDGLDAHSQFGVQAPPESVTAQVKAALDVLHDKDFVHGDVCRSNILVEKTDDITSLGPKAGTDVDALWHAYLIDFAWAGKAKKDVYSPLLNMENPRPRGALPGKLMETAHDDLMLQRIINPPI